MSEMKELKAKVKNLKVLFADDEKEIRDSVGDFLKKFFDDVVICSDGLEAFEAFNKSKDFDIVMTDVLMPKMDGIVLINKIKEIKPEIFTVIMSASKSNTPFDQSDYHVFLKKPASFDELIVVLRKVKEAL
jgi:DNA-binding NtrC family response regulator